MEKCKVSGKEKCVLDPEKCVNCIFCKDSGSGDIFSGKTCHGNCQTGKILYCGQKSLSTESSPKDAEGSWEEEYDEIFTCPLSEEHKLFIRTKKAEWETLAEKNTEDRMVKAVEEAKFVVIGAKTSVERDVQDNAVCETKNKLLEALNNARKHKLIWTKT